MEQVALLAQQYTLPEPTLDLSLLSYSAGPPPSLSAAYTNNQPPTTAHNSTNGAAAAPAAVVRSSTSASTSATIVAPPPDDPWMTGARYAGAGAGAGAGAIAGASAFGVGSINGGGFAPPSSVSGSGLPSGWWKRQEKATVQFAGQQGFVLNRYMVYGISTEVRRCPVFTFIFIFADCNCLLYTLTLVFCVVGHHSAVALCIGDTPNSRSCGIVWFVDILSAYYRNYLPNELGVRDWNWLFGILIDIFHFF